MLPLPNLDDRYFEQLVNEAREMIPRLTKEWTDANDHDPGITLIELLSWLIEMQQYYMNKIVNKSEENFLKLLGVKLLPIQCAKVDITFDNLPCTIHLPKKSRFQARDLIFESDENHILINNSIEKIIVRDKMESIDYTNLNGDTDNSFYAFGESIEIGNSLFIGFAKPLECNQIQTIHFYLYDDYPIQIDSGPINDEWINSSGKVTWKFYGETMENGKAIKGWVPLKIINDETYHFTKSGKLTFVIPSEMLLQKIYPANDKGRFWISCSVEVPDYEISPRIKHIALNTISVIHRHTLSEIFHFHSDGRPKETIELTDYLSFYEEIEVQVKDHHGYWRTWNQISSFDHVDAHYKGYTVTKDEKTKKTILQFGDGIHGERLPAGENIVRVISYDRMFSPYRFLGTSNGLPNQSYELYDFSFIPESLLLQIGKILPNTKEVVWEDWTYVPDFMNSSNEDKHFVYDYENSTFVFGNNEKGVVPEDSDFANIKIIRCHLGGGSKGNIKEHLIDTIISDDPLLENVFVTNYQIASGGLEKESLLDAKQRLLDELENHTERAITSKDYEMLAKNTPGLRVARAKALPLYSVGLQDYPNNKMPAVVTIVVVPYSEEKKPLPSEGFLKNVKAYLNQHRLLTTELHVIAPEYIKITIYAVVVVEPYMKGEAKKIIDALNKLLDPLNDDQRGGWEFGRSVYKGDIYSVISEIEGVTFIKDLWIEGEGRGIRKESSGNIIIPPHGLVYPGDHQIEVISRTDL